MEMEDRRTNGEEDLPAQFLNGLYDRIEKDEIRLNTRPGQPTSSMEDATRLWEGVMNRTRLRYFFYFTTYIFYFSKYIFYFPKYFFL